MKTKRNKRGLSGLFVFALLATTTVEVAESKKSEATMSDLVMANVETLANGESGGREDCEPAYDICCELVIYPDESYGEDCLLGHTKKPGWL